MMQDRRIGSILVANRSEIAICVFRAASELGIRTVGVYAEEDKLSLHRLKCDEAYHLGSNIGPIAAYLDMARIIDVAVAAKVDALHPGYGFLSENPEFAESCAHVGLIFIGPSPDTMWRLGDKVSARGLDRRWTLTMPDGEPATTTMRTVRFYNYGEPADVLRRRRRFAL